MMVNRKSVLGSLALVAGLVAGLTSVAQGALAYESGDLILRAGVASVQPDEDSSVLKLNGGALAGTRAGVDNSAQLGLTATYMLTPHVGVGVLAASPFQHDIRAAGLGIDAGKIKHLPPTVTLQYFPLDAGSAFQPYIGVGVNYTVFFSEHVDSQLEAALDSSGDLDMDNSFGWAAQAGADYALDDHWVVNAAVWYLAIDTDATFRFDSGDRVTAQVDINPWVYMVGLGYRF